MARSEQRVTTPTRPQSARAAAPVAQASRTRGGRLVPWLTRHWLPVFCVVWGLYVGLPWLAPLFMQFGWTGAANAIYTGYMTQCHQLPQRSFFLFGAQPMYTLEEIQAAFQNTNNPLILRQFVGNAEMGWKVAWSDRMVAMYTSPLLFALIYALIRRRVRPIRWWIALLLVVPLALDGTTHMISDMISGIGGGFRDTNAWLAAITGNALPPSFYAGDALGSFNSWLRLISGVLFGFAVVWFGFPHLDRLVNEPPRGAWQVSGNR